MPRDLTDRTLLDQLARTRWGPTGFRCPHCAHPHASLVRSRPRVRVCRHCRKQTSVTSGTLLQASKLPLKAWVLRLECEPELWRLPTMTECAEELEISRSSAWLLSHKTFVAWEIAQQWLPPEGRIVLNLPMRLRPPKRPTLPESAPANVRELHRRLHLRELSPGSAPVSLDLVPGFVALHAVALPEAQRHQRSLMHFEGAPRHHQGIVRWLTHQLHHLHHAVSLAWLPRWMHAVLFVWNRSLDPNGCPPSWSLLVAAGPRPLRALSPWISPP